MWGRLRAACCTLFCGFILCAAVPCGRDPRVAEVLHVHEHLIDGAVHDLRAHDVFGIFGVQPPRHAAKLPAASIPARESTIVANALDMRQAIAASVVLPFAASAGMIDDVLGAVIRASCDSSVDVTKYRQTMRGVVREVRDTLAPLRLDLQALVPPFLRPIVGHVDFAILEVFVRVIEWVHVNYIDQLIYGFLPVGDIFATGVNRPFVDKPRAEFSRSDNAKSFDDDAAISGHNGLTCMYETIVCDLHDRQSRR